MSDDPEFMHPNDVVAYAEQLILVTQVGVSAPNAQLSAHLRAGPPDPGHCVGLAYGYTKVGCAIGCDHQGEPLILTHDQAGALAGMLEAWANLLPEDEYRKYESTSSRAREAWDVNFRDQYGSTLP